MNSDFLTVYNNPSNKRSYDVLIENKVEGGVSATVLGWQDCQARGSTKAEALEQLRKLLTARLQNTEIVSLEIDLPKPEHPWMKFAGMFKDDPDFEDVLADIAAYRQELDQEQGDYYRQLDAEEEIH
ncbi:MAG TPA: HicB family protein [Cyanobacteria bacterium UBA12227]|nr:HicB family protein [Cyanobacteria bacterium UBA12227]HAX89836.1 HicB family protein [Cyanobacteria bacterium UBA11370]HBY78043.1 HicB family protein [Cyanobacteria bacterium UBA11148]